MVTQYLPIPRISSNHNDIQLNHRKYYEKVQRIESILNDFHQPLLFLPVANRCIFEVEYALKQRKHLHAVNKSLINTLNSFVNFFFPKLVIGISPDNDRLLVVQSEVPENVTEFADFLVETFKQMNELDRHIIVISKIASQIMKGVGDRLIFNQTSVHSSLNSLIESG
jgi:hypothetical protein